MLLPKGGGAIRGIGETFSTNSATGTLSLTVPIATSPARSGFELGLHLTYDSGAGSGPFGLGWRLSIPSIARKTDKGLPRYDDDEKDVFVLSGAEDLVPIPLAPDAARREVDDVSYAIRRYRPRTEGLFARIERWTASDGDVHWRVFTKNNVLNVYGRTSAARICDPADPTRIFSWLLEETRDDRGNVAGYTYKAEDGAGVPSDRASESNRFDATKFLATAQRYPKRIRYGNRTPLLDRAAPLPGDDSEAPAPADETEWFFEVVFDYGEHTENSTVESAAWPIRTDPFSTYRSTFEVRTYRLCRRVLMFHRFAELGQAPCLVRSTDFTYEEARVTKAGYDQGPAPIVNYLSTVTQSGYRATDAGYERAMLPPLKLGYVPPSISEHFQALDRQSLEGIAHGVEGSGAQWVDLDGEGIPGVLIATDRAWFYKRNLGGANLSVPSLLKSLPRPASLGAGAAHFTDLGADGNLDLVRYSAPLSGYFERTDEKGWAPFVAFQSLPNIDWNGPNLRLIDLDGDGFPDVLITEHEAFVTYRSRAKQGFEAAVYATKPRDEQEGPAIIFADGTETIQLADMSGDGLTDIVRVRNGEVCYWPNLGYGRFGRKLTLDRSPRFDAPDQFDPKRIRFADIDGSGTSDILYLGRDGVRVYFNCAGNALSLPLKLDGVPAVDSLSTLSVVDLFGRGTPCLLLSNPLSVSHPVAYAEILGWSQPDATIAYGKKPHLLESIVNNMGAESRITYASSTKFYLMDQAEGRPWLTRLPFPVHVIEKTERIDYFARSSLVTRYRYHHGYYDGVEREFRGFARVDQWDDEVFREGEESPASGGAPADPAHACRQSAARITSWYHTGVWLGREQLETRLQLEYWQEDPKGPFLPDTLPLPGTTPREQREAARALRGVLLRQEVYAEDGKGEVSKRPFSVSERSYTVRMLAAAVGDAHAVFFTHPVETFDVRYERVPDDPRTTHTLVVKVDDFGNVLESASVAYARRTADGALPPRFQIAQDTTLVTYRVTALTNPIDDPRSYPADYRAPLAAESRTYEIVGAQTSPDPIAKAPKSYFSVDDVKPFPKAPSVDYANPPAATPPAGVVLRRRVDHERTIYRADDLSGPLGLTKVESLALTFETYKLAFTSDLLSSVFQRNSNGVTTDLLADRTTMLATVGGYQPRASLVGESGFPASDVDDDDGDWWIPSGRVYLSETKSGAQELGEASKDFFLPKRSVDPFGNPSIVRYDKSRLLVIEAEDTLGNLVTAGELRAGEAGFAPAVDYGVLQPNAVMDTNDNREGVRFDALGNIIASARMGKVKEADGQPKGDLLRNVKNGQTDLDAFFQNPLGQAENLLGDATRRFVYDLFAYAKSKDSLNPQPVVVATIARETHLADLAPGQTTELELAFAYFDGLGRAIQTKTRAEAGPLVDGGKDIDPRWVGSGWVVLNNKGNAVRKYEPFFSAAQTFEFAATGVSNTLFYDPLDRVIATLFPNHTYEKVVFDAWREARWDANDTSTTAPEDDEHVGALIRQLPQDEYSPGWPDAIATGADVHAGTPRQVFVDVLGRPFLAVAHNRYKGAAGALVDELLPTFTKLDIEGLERSVVDAKRQNDATSLEKIHGEGRVVMSYAYDVANRRIFHVCMDAGERWTLPDIGGRQIYAWDRMGRAFRFEYDELRRPTASYVKGQDAVDPTKEILFERSTYGIAAQKNVNACGRLLEQHDSAGVLRRSYDFKGNVCATNRQLAAEFKALLDWATAPALEPHPYTTTTSHDAVDQVVRTTARNEAVNATSTTIFTRNRRRSIDRIQVGAAGGAPSEYVTKTTYNAKGQRTTCSLANGIETTWSYDSRSARLESIETTRAGASALQSLAYTYDAVGNIAFVADGAQQTTYFQGDEVAPTSAYTYDATYRLITASGREHLGQAGQPAPDARRTGRTKLAHPHDLQKLRNYLERYDYDEVGNIVALTHDVPNDPTHAQSFTRDYEYARASCLEQLRTGNVLTSTTVGGEVSAYDSDEHANMVKMPHLSIIAWDALDRLSTTARQVADVPETTHFVYDAHGSRVRKVTCAQANGSRRQERVYVDGFEVFRTFDGASVSAEVETVHVLDGERRVALIETPFRAGSAALALVTYQLSDHLGSSTVEVNTEAVVVSCEEYYPYGRTAYQVTSSQRIRRFRYTGKECDTESGFYSFGRRYYAAWLGRWSSPDPLGLVDGVNRFAYARGSPNNLVDRVGLAAGPTEQQRGMNAFDFDDLKIPVHEQFATKSTTRSSFARRQLDVAVLMPQSVLEVDGAKAPLQIHEIEFKIENPDKPNSSSSRTPGQTIDAQQKVDTVESRSNKAPHLKGRTAIKTYTEAHVTDPANVAEQRAVLKDSYRNAAENALLHDAPKSSAAAGAQVGLHVEHLGEPSLGGKAGVNALSTLASAKTPPPTRGAGSALTKVGKAFGYAGLLLSAVGIGVMLYKGQREEAAEAAVDALLNPFPLILLPPQGPDGA